MCQTLSKQLEILSTNLQISYFFISKHFHIWLIQPQNTGFLNKRDYSILVNSLVQISTKIIFKIKRRIHNLRFNIHHVNVTCYYFWNMDFFRNTKTKCVLQMQTYRRCPKQRFATLSDGTLKNILNDKESDDSMVTMVM